MKKLMVCPLLIGLLLWVGVTQLNGQSTKQTSNEQPLQASQEMSPEVVLANAYELSWTGKYNEAINTFQRAIDLGANWQESQLGLGYTYAWSKKYRQARHTFTEILKRNRDNFNAQKGIAFSYLWQGNYEASIHYFDQILPMHADDYDLWIGKGLAHLNYKDNQAAESAFATALQYRPESTEAANLLKAAKQSVNLLILDLWTGFSWLDQSDQKFGLRGLQASVQVTRTLRSFVKYDNSLTLDVLSYVQRGKSAPTISTGVVQEWNKEWLSQLEYGLRFLEKDQIQHLISGAQVYFLPENYRLKVGGLLGFGQNLDEEWMGYLALNIPVFDYFRLEPIYYYIQPSLVNNPEHRLQLNAQFFPLPGYEFNLYGMYGRGAIMNENDQQRIYGWGLSGLIPFGEVVAGQIQLRQEKTTFQDFTSLALGLKVSLDKR